MLSQGFVGEASGAIKMMMKKLAINTLKGLSWFALAVLLLVLAWLASNNQRWRQALVWWSGGGCVMR